MVDGADYGANKVRYPAPVPVVSRIRLHASLAAAEPVSDTGLRAALDLEFEVAGQERPACVAQIVFVYWFAETARA